VREVLGRRLDRLSPECNELLTLAAVAGRDFTYDLLGAVSGHDDARLLALVEEAIEGRVIGETERPGAYRFSHALVQETLLGEISTTRRVRLHGQVAEALERLYGGQAARHAAELAQHFVESATLTRAHAGKGVRYSKLAAEQAEAATAWDEGARHYENCLALITAADDGLGQDEAVLLMAAGRCHALSADDPATFRAAWRNLMRAVTLYRERGDGLGLARATLEAVEIQAGRERLIVLVDQALAALGDRDPYLAFRLLMSRAGLDASEASEHAAHRAIELGRQHGYPDLEPFLARRKAGEALREWRIDDALAIYRSLFEIYDAAGNYERAADVQRGIHNWTLLTGRLDDAEAEAAAGLAYLRRVHLSGSAQYLAGMLAIYALMRGDFDRFEALFAEIPGEWFVIAVVQMTRAEIVEDFDRAIALAPTGRGVPPDQVPWNHAVRARVLYNAGDMEGARRELAAALATLPSATLLDKGLVAALDECLVALGDDATVQAVYDEAAGWTPIRYAATGSGVDHVRGALALRLGRIDDAETWYRTGLEWAERERCPLEQGRCLQGLAEVAERRGRHGEAVGYLDRAAALFQQYGATLYLRQVLAKKEILKA
jgi:tetratricopeptide (TPR) repeat protein